MIIECPACTTRYDIKADLPPDGRTVRCAKCGTVWRAIPEPQEAPAPEEAVWTATGAEEPAASHDEHEHGEDRHAAASVHSRDDAWTSDEGGAVATFEESLRRDAGAPIDASDDAEETHAEESDDAGQSRDTGKVSWFQSFRRKKKKEEAEETLVAAEAAQGRGETIPFPRPSVPAEAPAATEDEFRTLEEARQAVRSVFSTLSEGRASAPFAARALPAAVSAPAEEERDEAARAQSAAETEEGNAWAGAPSREAEPPSFWASAGAASKGWDATLAQPETDAWQGPNGRGEVLADARDGHAIEVEHEPAAEESSEADDALREAMRAHFPSSGKPAPLAPAPDTDLALRLETHLRSTAASASKELTPPNAVSGLRGEAPPELDEEMSERPEIVEDAPEIRDDDVAFDRRLYREIEETQEKSGGVRRRSRRGGLALAAGWGLFICVAGGLVASFFAFRDMVADAAPGLAPLYRSLGMPVTVQPLVFEGVQYNWKVVENKPVLVVSGSVYNRAQRKVRVPQFYITIKDQDPALDRETSANLKVARSKIRADEHADFDIELASPSPTITSVELELRNVR